MPIKLIKAIPMSPVIIKEMPKPRKGAGMLEYLSFSRMAAMAIIARNQPIPEPNAKPVTSPTEA